MKSAAIAKPVYGHHFKNTYNSLENPCFIDADAIWLTPGIYKLRGEHRFTGIVLLDKGSTDTETGQIFNNIPVESVWGDADLLKTEPSSLARVEIKNEIASGSDHYTSRKLVQFGTGERKSYGLLVHADYQNDTGIFINLHSSSPFYDQDGICSIWNITDYLEHFEEFDGELVLYNTPDGVQTEIIE